MNTSIYVTVQYDNELQRITKVSESPMVIFGNQTFPYLLMNIFLEHPELEKYKPGELGFLINGVPPRTSTVLHDGDLVALSAHKTN